jgi:hypothetical protein
MTGQTIAQDVVIYFVLLGIVFMYRTPMKRHVKGLMGSRLVFLWTWIGALLSSYFICVGFLHQIGMLVGIPAYALFVVGILLLLLCLRAFRMKLREANAIDTWNDNSEGK